MASASALVRVLRPLAEPPGMLKVGSSSEVSVLLSVSRETRAFISPL